MIKRYNPKVIGEFVGMSQSLNGRYLMYSDVSAKVKEIMEFIEGAEKRRMHTLSFVSSIKEVLKDFVNE